AETAGFEQGQMSTAELLAAREAAEERLAWAGGNRQPYQDEGSTLTTDEFREKDTGRPNWPDKSAQTPLDQLDPPRANAPLWGGAPDVFGMTLPGRQDQVTDRASA